LDGEHVWLIEQFRHPLQARAWEFPQGAWEDDPDAPDEALARGELVEETGLRAASLERLGRLHFAYGITNQHVDVWLATGLSEGEATPEDTEHDLRCRRFAVSEFEAMIRSGEVSDAASVAAWHLVTTR
jgi:8-oxo-dGTP pyrophosphatase MutT (NUDIX family)